MKKIILKSIFLFFLTFHFNLNETNAQNCKCSEPGWGCGLNDACKIGCRAFCSGTNCTSTPTISANDSLTFCSGGNVVLTAHRLNPVSYQWIRNSLNIAGATSSTYTASTSGFYQCYVKNNCNTKISIGKTVEVETNPTSIITVVGSLSFCNGDSVTLIANSNAHTFQWKRNGVNISGATSQTFTAKTTGGYSCKIINSCGNKISRSYKVTNPCRNSGVHAIDDLEHLSVFPNPATDMITVRFPSDESGEILISNLFGQIIYTEKINSEEIKIDVNSFLTGIYFIKWESGENYETKMFSVVK